MTTGAKDGEVAFFDSMDEKASVQQKMGAAMSVESGSEVVDGSMAPRRVLAHRLLPRPKQRNGRGDRKRRRGEKWVGLVGSCRSDGAS